MSEHETPSTKMPPQVAHSPNQLPGTGLVGLIFSVLGLAGWLTVLTLLLLMPYEAKTGDGQRDLFIGIGNLFTYLMRVCVGAVGLAVNGTLSIAGTIASSVTLAHQPRERWATIGLYAGAAGLVIGGLLVMWRIAVWRAVLS